MVLRVLGLLALTLPAFPFLEVWFIGPTEEFQAHDILEVSAGIVIATSIATFALLIGIVVVIGFIFVTQPTIAQETAALVPTLAAGLPALISILSSVFAGGSGTSVGGSQ